MTDYTQTTNFAQKDSLPSGNPSKVVKGSEFQQEFTNIATAVGTKADKTGANFTGSVTMQSDLVVDTNTFTVDSSESKVGIGTTTPTEKLDINGDSIRLRTAQTPASAGAAGSQGQIAWDSNYIYVCIATNTWKRVAISTWS
jgi:hypothetical protein